MEPRLKKVATLSHTIAEAGLELDQVLITVTKWIGETFGDACIVLMASETKNQLECVAFFNPDDDAPQQVNEMLAAMQTKSERGIGAEMSVKNSPVVVHETKSKALKSLAPKGYKTIYDQYPVHSALLAPLKVQKRLIGILGVLRFEPGVPHAAEEAQLLENVAGQAALAIESARLYARETQRARILDGLHTATTALLTTLDLDELLGRILDAAQSAIPAAEKGMLHLVAPDSGKLQTSALLGFTETTVKPDSYEVIGDYITQVVRERQPLLISDTESLPINESNGQLIKDHQIRSTIIAPLILGDTVLGVLSLNASHPQAFTEADLRVLESFAATTSAAIQNARLHAKVQRLAITDALTGLYNRRGFYELGRREIERVRRFGHPLSAIMLDIDHFKMINDTYGHATGDQVLRALAERLNNNIRGVDILGRYGGDEFSILLPETDLKTASVIGARLRRSIAKHPVTTDDGLLTVTISMGIAKATEDMLDLDSLLNLADGAMYSAKQGGRDRVEIEAALEDN